MSLSDGNHVFDWVHVTLPGFDGGGIPDNAQAVYGLAISLQGFTKVRKGIVQLRCADPYTEWTTPSLIALNNEFALSI